MSVHEHIHSLKLKVLSELHPLPLQLHHLLLLRTLDPLVDLPELQYRPRQFPTRRPIRQIYALHPMLPRHPPIKPYTSTIIIVLVVDIIIIIIAAKRTVRGPRTGVNYEIRVRVRVRVGFGLGGGLDGKSNRGGLLGNGVGTDERVEAVEEGPLGRRGFGLLELVLLLQRVDPVLALDVRLARLNAVLTSVDGVGDLLPVLLTEVTTVELDITVSPGLDQYLRGALAPTILPPPAAAAADGTVVGPGGRFRTRAVHVWSRVGWVFGI